MSDFDHILKWKLLRGSHDFPGPEGGTCINEAAVVACGYPYRRVGSVKSMPDCFSRPICQLAMQLNDSATDEQRQRLMPFVTRLACADTPAIERERTRYIGARVGIDPFCLVPLDFDRALGVLEGALAIGLRAEPLGLDEAASRLDALRAAPLSKRRRSRLLPTKVKEWFGLQKTLEDVK